VYLSICLSLSRANPLYIYPHRSIYLSMRVNPRGPTQRGGPHRGPTTGEEGHTGDPHRTHTDNIYTLTCEERRSDLKYACVCIFLSRVNRLGIYLFLLSCRRRRWPCEAQSEPVPSEPGHTYKHTTRTTHHRREKERNRMWMGTCEERGGDITCACVCISFF